MPTCPKIKFALKVARSERFGWKWFPSNEVERRARSTTRQVFLISIKEKNGKSKKRPTEFYNMTIKLASEHDPGREQ